MKNNNLIPKTFEQKMVLVNSIVDMVNVISINKNWVIKNILNISDSEWIRHERKQKLDKLNELNNES